LFLTFCKILHFFKCWVLRAVWHSSCDGLCVAVVRKGDGTGSDQWVMSWPHWWNHYGYQRWCRKHVSWFT
jgi:hypothetical protein